MFCIVCGSWTCHVFSSQSFSLQEEGELNIENVHLLQCSNQIDEPRLFSISESIVLVFFSFNRTSNTTHYLRFWWILLVFALTRLTAEAELIHWCYTTTLRIMSRAAASACSASRSLCCASARTRWPDIYISTYYLYLSTIVRLGEGWWAAGRDVRVVPQVQGQVPWRVQTPRRVSQRGHQDTSSCYSHSSNIIWELL